VHSLDARVQFQKEQGNGGGHARLAASARQNEHLPLVLGEEVERHLGYALL